MIVDVKIEKNVPMPTGHKNTVWPFVNMKVGDSFAVPDELIIQAAQAMCHFGRRHNMKFSRRKTRIWRIK